MRPVSLRPTSHLLLLALLFSASACKQSTDPAPRTEEQKAAPSDAPGTKGVATKEERAGKTAAVAPSEPTSDTSAPGTGEAARAGAETSETITILSAGADPKRELRYQFQKGRTKTFKMQMKLQMSALSEGGPAQTMPETTFEFGGTTTTREVLPDGKAIRDTTFTSFTPRSAEIPPQMAEQMKRQMKSFEGMKLTEAITAQGKVDSVEVDESSVTSEQAQMFLRSLMEGMSNAFLPLPKEPVGVGARWEGTTVVSASGVRVIQKGLFELTELKGAVAKVKVTFQQSADPQEVTDPAMNPALKTELLSMTGTGSGQTEMNLATLRIGGHVAIQTTTKTRVTSREVAPDPTLPVVPAGVGEARSVDSTLTTEVSVAMQID